MAGLAVGYWDSKNDIAKQWDDIFREVVATLAAGPEEEQPIVVIRRAVAAVSGK